MGCHIDGFIDVVAHTHVLQDGRVIVRVADLIDTANTGIEVALRLVRPWRKNKYITEVVQKVVITYNCKIIELKYFMINGNKVILSMACPDTKVDDAKLEENEVYVVEFIASTGVVEQLDMDIELIDNIT